MKGAWKPEGLAERFTHRVRPHVFMLWKAFWRAGCRVNGLKHGIL